MNEPRDDMDPWSLEEIELATTQQPTPALSIETIEGVEPLGEQFGVHPPKPVPEALREPLFGQPEPSETELEQYGSTEAVPPLQTYAVLDAGKVFGLPEMLGSSGLEHRCLFKGDAYDELKDVAPWIVRLEEDNYFSAKLFTAGKPPWCMWDKEPGIYVRSRAGLEDMWRHFRKFTRVQDENGKWYYFRFWEGRYLSALCQDNQDNSKYNGIVRDLIKSHVIYAKVQNDVFKFTEIGVQSVPAAVQLLNRRDMLILEKERLHQFAEKCHAYLQSKNIGLRRYVSTDSVVAALRDGKRAGLKSEKQFIQYLISHADAL